MYSRVLTSGIRGISGELSWAEVAAENGLPGFNIVGLGSQSVKEARERIHSALENCGFGFPVKRITVNLTPANRKKDGSHYDLPIALGLLICSGYIDIKEDCRGTGSGRTACLGELTLDGRINAVEGVLPMIAGLKESGVERVIVPKDNAAEAALVDGIQILPASDLRQAADYICGFDTIRPAVFPACSMGVPDAPDFSDIRGQEYVKRAAQLAAAGMHGMIMVGPPGVGKTMVGKRIVGLLPELTYEEQLEVTRIYSVAGELRNGMPMIRTRPFRAPHHSSSRAALVGGGSVPRPGEISLAHRGILFLDELPEFASGMLDALRQPLEDGYVSINRANARFDYPASFMLVAAMNPCRCGYWGDPVKPCTCSESERQKYLGKVSGPIMDRIDIHVSMERIVYEDLSTKSADGSSTESLRKEVMLARQMQEERYKGLKVRQNSQLDAGQTEKYCIPDAAGKKLIKEAFKRWNMSARAYHRLLRLSRTIADTDGSDIITDAHVLEALKYRFPDNAFR